MAKIVVIDDSKLMRNVIRPYLEQAGHTVDEWVEVSAMEVADRMEASQPDLIITDYQMPGCNGATIAKLARQVAPQLPIIVVTATHDPTVAGILENLKVTKVLFKPLKGEELVAAVAGALALRSETEEPG